MPEQSTIQSFINALQSGQTTITIALKQLWDQRATLDPALIARVATLPLTPLDPDVKTQLGLRGCATKELDHIDHWPASEKQKVRRAIMRALGSDPQREVEFFWELYGGSVSVAQVDNLNGPGTISIRFRSPRQNIRVMDTPIAGELIVELEEPEAGDAG